MLGYTFPKPKPRKHEYKTLNPEIVNLLALHGYSEGGQKSDIEDSIRIVVSEANKSGKTIVAEIFTIKEGGHAKYTWTNTYRAYLKRSKLTRSERNKFEVARYYAKHYLLYERDLKVRYNHYVASWMFCKRKVPKWYREHVVSYKISGDTVFAELNFSLKTLKYYEIKDKLDSSYCIDIKNKKSIKKIGKKIN